MTFSGNLKIGCGLPELRRPFGPTEKIPLALMQRALQGVSWFDIALTRACRLERHSLGLEKESFLLFLLGTRDCSLGLRMLLRMRIWKNLEIGDKSRKGNFCPSPIQRLKTDLIRYFDSQRQITFLLAQTLSHRIGAKEITLVQKSGTTAAIGATSSNLTTLIE